MRVALAQWMPYYRFAREETLAAGTRIRIHSGRESDPAIAGPNEIQRFVTPPFDGATIQFTDTHIDLRVVGPDGAEHTRRFLADSSYGDVDYKLLRKDDDAAAEPVSG